MPADRILVRGRRLVRDRILGILLPDRVSFPFAEWNKNTVKLSTTFIGRKVRLKTTTGEHVGIFLSCNNEGVYLSVEGKDTYVPFNSLISLQALEKRR